MAQEPSQAALKGALFTVTALIGGLILSFLLGSAVFDALPNHSIDNPNPLHIATGGSRRPGGYAGWRGVVGHLDGRAGRPP